MGNSKKKKTTTTTIKNNKKNRGKFSTYHYPWSLKRTIPFSWFWNEKNEHTELSSSSLRKYDRDVEMDLWNEERNVIVEPKRWKKFCVYTGCHDNQNPFSLNRFSPVHDCVFPLMELTSLKLVKPKMPEGFTSLVDVLFDGSFIYLYLFVLISTLGLPGVGSVLSTKRLQT